MNPEGTLLDILFAAARDSPDQVIVHVDGEGGERVHTHQALLDDSLHVAGGLAAAGIAAGTPVIILPNDSADYHASFGAP